jgi:hypothetical protein
MTILDENIPPYLWQFWMSFTWQLWKHSTVPPMTILDVVVHLTIMKTFHRTYDNFGCRSLDNYENIPPYLWQFWMKTFHRTYDNFGCRLLDNYENIPQYLWQILDENIPLYLWQFWMKTFHPTYWTISLFSPTHLHG